MSAGNPNPYADQPSGTGWTRPGFGSPAPAPLPPARPTAPLAIVSLSSAVLSIPALCLCFLSVIPSTIAIICGHLARRQIRNSAGTLEGGGLAMAGLCIGYPVLSLSFAYIAFVVYAIVTDEGREPDDPPAHQTSAQLHLERAEKLIGDSRDERGYGNNPEAQALARRYASQLKVARDELFTKRSRPPARDQFVTYCALSDGRCVFLVYVPEYRRFNQEAKDDLAEIAWMTAQTIASTKLKPGDELAVGLKGQFLFGSIRIGELAEEGAERNTFYEGDEEDLVDFFDTPEEGLSPEMQPEEIDLTPAND